MIDEVQDETIASGVRAPEHTGAPRKAEDVEISGEYFVRGTLVGRYVIVSTIGRGGMGVVYSAYDPELDRKVAIKLVLPSLDGDRGRARLLREAQALAKLNHPSVVTIHDVGTVGESVWIAMEFVDGQTLGVWAKKKPPSWRDVVEVMVQAGRGLAAAHTAGLLHRDFKPENVMVDRDGRARVMDFGLARERPQGALATDLRETKSEVTGASLLSEQLSHTGARVGTPLYMAPEQHCREELSSATDQFAFCVTFWKLLFGEHPFAENDGVLLRSAVVGGVLRRPSRSSKVPAWLRRLCTRGLLVEPEHRFPSMDALLAALAAGQRRAAFERAALVLGVLAAIVVGFIVYDVVL